MNSPAKFSASTGGLTKPPERKSTTLAKHTDPTHSRRTKTDVTHPFLKGNTIARKTDAVTDELFPASVFLKTKADISAVARATVPGKFQGFGIWNNLTGSEKSPNRQNDKLRNHDDSDSCVNGSAPWIPFTSPGQ